MVERNVKQENKKGYIMKKKTTKKKTLKKNKLELWKFALPVGLALIGGLGATGFIKLTENKITLEIEYAKDAEPVYEDMGEYEEEIPTVEEIDGGGRFQDTINVGNGEEALYYELGSIEEVDTSSPEAFKRSTLGRCIRADNYWGAQCVSIARAFWWGYAGFDVSTCGTGLAKGMMNCPEENARDKFKVIWDKSEIQDGTWIVLDGKTTGHVCMALSKPNGDYVSCLGENQGGIPCEGMGGAGTNIINISLKNFIGGYTPLDYIVPEPEPEPEPLAPDTGRK